MRNLFFSHLVGQGASNQVRTEITLERFMVFELLLLFKYSILLMNSQVVT